MANNLDSNITRKIMRAFVPAIEKQRVLSKTVNTQLFAGDFNPSSGDSVDIKRPHQYRAVETATGNITSAGTNTIIAGKATATVQDYITVSVPWTNKEEALDLDQQETILQPAAEECVTTLETNLNIFMNKNLALTYGSPGTVVDAWSDIAGPMSLMKSIGVPGGMHHYVMNPFTVQNLAGAQTGLSADPSRLVQTAWEQAQISTPFAGMRAISSNSLATYTSGTLPAADRVGSLAATPTATYLAHKDTMIQTLSLENLSTAGASTIKAGEVIEVTGRYYTHQKTRQTFTGADGNPIKWRATVTEDAAVASAGTATITVAGAAIYESGSGQYDNISAALTSGDVVTVLGADSTNYQPNLFYHKDAIALAFVQLPKLFSTDTIYNSSDGLSIRCSKYSDGDANTQKIRFDILPAFGCLNPFYGGKGFGA